MTVLYILVHDGTIYFLSRPRRFGKSLLVSTLKNYFLGRKELFRGLAIDSLETEWAEYPVFHIDFNGEDFTMPGTLEGKIESLIATWEKEYGRNDEAFSLGSRFAYVLSRAHERCGRRCVVLIDEYDKPILDVLDTDITVDVSVFSGFNQPADISMDPRYETLCGITQQELEDYFAEAIEEMAGSQGISGDEMCKALKRQYDGYHFSKNMTDVYNPFSLLNAFASQDIRDYWFSSGTPSYLVRLLSHTDDNLNEITGRYYDPREFVDYKATVEKPLPMIYQSGYLTIKDYKPRRRTFLLDFPNNEVKNGFVKNGFVSLVAADYLKPRTESVDSWVQDLLDALEDGNTDRLCKLFTSFLSDIPYAMQRKENEREKERYFHYTFYLIFRLVSVYTVYAEKQQSEGRVDCIVEDGSADDALTQIEEKGYARPYAADSRRLYKIGAVFSSQTGTISEWKVE